MSFLVLQRRRRRNLTADLPTLLIAATGADKPEGNSGTTAFTFTVTRAGADLSGASSATWAVTGTGGNPASPSDFVGGVFPSGTVSFAAGETTKTITVNVQGDTAVEPDETFLVTLSNPSGAVLATASALGTIRNDDEAPPETPFLSVFAVSADKAEGNSGTTPFTFEIRRTGDLSGTASVTWTVVHNTTNASDFTGPVTGTVNFAANQDKADITVNVVGDTIDEPDESFTVTLSNAVGATLGTVSAPAVIRNDDGVSSLGGFTRVGGRNLYTPVMRASDPSGQGHNFAGPNEVAGPTDPNGGTRFNAPMIQEGTEFASRNGVFQGEWKWGPPGGYGPSMVNLGNGLKPTYIIHELRHGPAPLNSDEIGKIQWDSRQDRPGGDDGDQASATDSRYRNEWSGSGLRCEIDDVKIKNYSPSTTFFWEMWFFLPTTWAGTHLRTAADSGAAKLAVAQWPVMYPFSSIKPGSIYCPDGYSSGSATSMHIHLDYIKTGKLIPFSQILGKWTHLRCETQLSGSATGRFLVNGVAQYTWTNANICNRDYTGLKVYPKFGHYGTKVRGIRGYSVPPSGETRDYNRDDFRKGPIPNPTKPWEAASYWAPNATNAGVSRETWIAYTGWRFGIL